jgi:hypothetical protein
VPTDEHSTLETSSAWEEDAQFREKKHKKGKKIKEKERTEKIKKGQKK